MVYDVEIPSDTKDIYEMHMHVLCQYYHGSLQETHINTGEMLNFFSVC